MILKESYSKEWIGGIRQDNNKINPPLIEKVIFALSLVEQLQINGLDFVFKGGTSLILLLGEPKRLSIDIDIIVNPQHKASLENILNLLVGQGVFERYEKNEREAKTDIPKAHYKFYFQSAIFEKIQYILLDVLFEESPYTQIMNIPVRSKFISCDQKTTKVKIPSLNCILGDKLTAFAPNTTGIRYDIDKELEIIKQLFDISTLFDLADDISVVKDNFNRIARQQIIYRGIKLIPDDVLMDIFETASVITSRGKKNANRYKDLEAGIERINSYIFTESFHLGPAILCASKAAYLSMVLLKNLGAIEKYTGNEEIGALNIEHSEFSKFNKLKRSDSQAFYYWFKAVELYGGTETPLTIGAGIGVSV
jgi:hypothetical protein